jgi:cobalt/nickel transport system ATP-binding protein
VTGAVAAFDIAGVHYGYRGVPALAGLSLTIPLGARVALIGANGSGKSTLLRLLDALCFPDAGTIRAFGEPLNEQVLEDEARAHAFRRRVGFVFQDSNTQLFNPTVFDELAFGPLQLGWPKSEIRRRIDEILEMFAIGELRHRSPHRLSGGEKKRVALAAVLITRPEVVLFDEPTAALDPQSQTTIIDFLGRRGGGMTFVTATHDLSTVKDIADHCILLEAGRVAAEGSPSAMVERARAEADRPGL